MEHAFKFEFKFLSTLRAGRECFVRGIATRDQRGDIVTLTYEAVVTAKLVLLI